MNPSSWTATDLLLAALAYWAGWAGALLLWVAWQRRRARRVFGHDGRSPDGERVALDGGRVGLAGEVNLMHAALVLAGPPLVALLVWLVGRA